MLRRAYLSCIVALAGCVETSSVTCTDGSVCPQNTECAAVTTAAGDTRVVCVLPQQLDACTGKEDGDSCDLEDAVAGGTCNSGTCIAVECGNGFLDIGEICDDENLSDDDDCSHDCRSTLVCRNGVLDTIRDEECDDGDPIGHDGCASTCELERPRWIPLEDESPSPRSFAGLAYDLGRRRAVLFGGMTEGGAPLDDTREWDGQRWWAAATGTTPSNRYAHTMAYDAARKQVVAFSGVNNQSDTWVYVDGAWQQLSPAHSPPSRDYAGMVYDSARKQIVLFGGFSTVTQAALDDTWVWDGTDWREITPATRPPATLGHAMAYDPRRNVTVLFGGGGTGPGFRDAVWELDGATWTNRTPTTGTLPTARAFASMAYDPTSGELLMTGGDDATTALLHDAYTWNGTRWLARPDLPTDDADEKFVAHVSATDPVRGRIVVVENTYGRLYEWNGTSWVAPPNGSASGASFSARDGAAIALDLRRNELVMFGGEIDNGGAPGSDNETWIFRGGTWRRAVTAAPTLGWGGAIAYDELRDQVVLYDGCPAVAQTWVWSGATQTWTQKSNASQPGPRCGASMTFDAKRGNAVLFGGSVGADFADGTWTWDGSTWTLELTPTTPPLRRQAAMGYDRVRERVILFGGQSPMTIDYGDTWSWDGSSWTELQPSLGPPPRSQTNAAWDPARARLVLAAGYSAEGVYTFSDAYEWDGAVWTPVASDFGARRLPAIATAPDGAGIVMVGGTPSPATNTPNRYRDTIRLRWDADRVAGEVCSGLDTDGDGLAGCADPDCWWSCSPFCPPRTSCVSTFGCGDGTCNPELESTFTCATDCGALPNVCGDFSCGAGETLASCPGDCTP